VLSRHSPSDLVRSGDAPCSRQCSASPRAKSSPWQRADPPPRNCYANLFPGCPTEKAWCILLAEWKAFWMKTKQQTRLRGAVSDEKTYMVKRNKMKAK